MTRVVLALNYYAPYVSGLTNVARDVAEGLAARGHDVTVVASRHDAALPLEERLHGVRVVRCPVTVRFGKGVVAASFIRRVRAEARDADVVNLHLPMLEAGLLSLALRGVRAAVVPTYHCDIALPAGAVSALQRAAIDAASRAAIRRADAVVVTSDDYADASRLAGALRRDRDVIPPGCALRTGGSPSYRETGGTHVGFLGRLVEEKGIEHLVRGFSAITDPDARLLIGGDYANVAGGSVIERVRRAIGEDPRIRILGFIPDDRMADFYASMDAFALTSVNSFEAFGIVQVEAMMAGVPAIASDLPGVRQPVHETGFGVVVPPRDPAAITAAIERIRTASFDVAGSSARAAELYGLPGVLDRYEALFARVAPTQSGR